MNINFTYYKGSNGIVRNTIEQLRFTRKLLMVVKRHNIEGFTLLKTLGAWQGKTEPSYQMTLVNINKQIVIDLARDLKDTWGQDSVMFTDDNGQVAFL